MVESCAVTRVAWLRLPQIDLDRVVRSVLVVESGAVTRVAWLRLVPQIEDRVV